MRRTASIPTLALATLGLLGAAGLGPTGGALAQPYRHAPPPPPPPSQTPYNQVPSLDRQQEQQREWLRQGVARGRITPREADRIREAMRELWRHERAAKADGVVTPAERRALREHAERVDALISRNYYDGQVRPPVWRDYWR